ncbi:hypothetical protein JCGZ_01116 [Jatropha curcas]|uniref:Rad60/SUMO-like domain-containing protein n=1 Tax=Jatropha curcas TaxID=180498 RepID=A0A067L5H5_JATCU|nr:small ubiquitin-related modifier 5 [Jatropha curcas]XP_020534594.1 small ubiquitin-related modifier 5 [Jatropha curcas]KDP39359.1 hypothetical protein JCGZ_01116 [Jatropha curcas]
MEHHVPPESLMVTVKGQDGRERQFKINKHNSSVEKLLHRYCEVNNLEYKTVTFLIKGLRFNPRKTPAELNLKNGVVIEAFLPVDGGGSGGEAANRSLKL